AEFETPSSGSYHLELTQKQGGQTLFQQSRGLSVGYAEELRLKPTNEDLLKQISASSGGTFALDPAETFKTDARSVSRPPPLGPSLAIAAVFLLVQDVPLRRIALTTTFRRKPRLPAPATSSTPIQTRRAG